MSDLPRLAIGKEGNVGPEVLESCCREREILFLVSTIDAADIPGSTLATCHNDRLCRIACKKKRLVPSRRKCTQIIIHLLWLSEETLGTISQMLNA